MSLMKMSLNKKPGGVYEPILIYSDEDKPLWLRITGTSPTIIRLEFFDKEDSFSIVKESLIDKDKFKKRGKQDDDG
jgi:hypothetical protein